MYSYYIGCCFHINFGTADERLLVKEIWPTPFVDVVDKTERKDLEDRQIVPLTFEDICNWAYVRRNVSSTDHTRAYHLLYKMPTNDVKDIFPIVLRVQGILSRFKLSVLGNWNG
jgi:hypothetical protein